MFLNLSYSSVIFFFLNLYLSCLIFSYDKITFCQVCCNHSCWRWLVFPNVLLIETVTFKKPSVIYLQIKYLELMTQQIKSTVSLALVKLSIISIVIRVKLTLICLSLYNLCQAIKMAPVSTKTTFLSDIPPPKGERMYVKLSYLDYTAS